MIPIATALPSGTYHYTIYSDGKAAGKSTIVVSRSDGSIRVVENTALSGDPIQTQRTLDPFSFSTLTYSVTSQGSTDTIDIPGAQGTWKSGTQTKTLPQATHGPSMIFDFLTAEYIALPAMLRAGEATTFNVYCVCFDGFEVKPAAFVPGTAPRPAGVTATDAVASFDFDDGISHMWYDPSTFVLHELDVPKPRIKIVMQP
jgi:hypothetical protein